jgi:hypothetical protein
MRIRAATATATATAVGLLAAGALGLSACNPADTGSNGAGRSSAATPGSGSKGSATAAVRSIPSLVGKGLQAAQDAARAAGFDHLTSHDSAGRDRQQILDRDWKVCSQSPAAGSVAATGAKLDLGAVKVAETCPPSDKAPPAKAGRRMPDFVGKALNTATGALPSDTSVHFADATGGRVIILQSDWRICTQKPAAGASLHGQPVAFSVVKFGEQCP